VEVLQREQEQFLTITVTFALGAPNIFSPSSVSPPASISSLSPRGGIISEDLQNPDYVKCKSTILTNFTNIITYY